MLRKCNARLLHGKRGGADDLVALEREYLAALAATGDAPLSAWDEGTLRRWLAEGPPPEGVDAEQWLESVRWSAKNALTAYTTLAAQLAAVRAERDALRAQVAKLTDAIRWALGEEGEFHSEPEPVPGKPRRRYWWRSELHQRAFPDATPARPTDTGRDG